MNSLYQIGDLFIDWNYRKNETMLVTGVSKTFVYVWYPASNYSVAIGIADMKLYDKVA